MDTVKLLSGEATARLLGGKCHLGELHSCMSIPCSPCFTKALPFLGRTSAIDLVAALAARSAILGAACCLEGTVLGV